MVPISNANGEDGVLVVVFWVIVYAVIDFCYEVLGAIAEWTRMILMSRNRRIENVRGGLGILYF